MWPFSALREEGRWHVRAVMNMNNFILINVMMVMILIKIVNKVVTTAAKQW